MTDSRSSPPGSINKKKERRKKKGQTYEELRLPAIVSFSSGRIPCTHAHTHVCTHAHTRARADFAALCSHSPSVRLGRDRCVPSWPPGCHHLELPAVHHGSSPHAAARQWPRGCCHGNSHTITVKRMCVDIEAMDEQSFPISMRHAATPMKEGRQAV